MARASLGSRTFVPLLAGALVRAALLFGPAGTVRWWQAWALLLTLSGLATLAAVTFDRSSPELLEERRTASKSAKRWDKPLVALAVGVLPMAQLVVAGLDRRSGWTRPMPPLDSALALAVVLAGGLTGFWAMRSNAFFSSFARIQTDRDHRVASGGPYRVVRHPAYVGWMLASVATGALLGSVWAIAIGAAIALLLVVRTALEDQMLLEELAGYRDYAARVRFRLVPFLW